MERPYVTFKGSPKLIRGRNRKINSFSPSPKRRGISKLKKGKVKMITKENQTVTKSRTKGRKVQIEASRLVAHIVEAIKDQEGHCISIPLSGHESLEIDVLTWDILYMNDKTGAEDYLDTVIFQEN